MGTTALFETVRDGVRALDIATRARATVSLASLVQIAPPASALKAVVAMAGALVDSVAAPWGGVDLTAPFAPVPVTALGTACVAMACAFVAHRSAGWTAVIGAARWTAAATARALGGSAFAWTRGLARVAA